MYHCFHKLNDDCCSSSWSTGMDGDDYDDGDNDMIIISDDNDVVNYVDDIYQGILGDRNRKKIYFDNFGLHLNL